MTAVAVKRTSEQKLYIATWSQTTAHGNRDTDETKMIGIACILQDAIDMTIRYLVENEELKDKDPRWYSDVPPPLKEAIPQVHSIDELHNLCNTYGNTFYEDGWYVRIFESTCPHHTARKALPNKKAKTSYESHQAASSHGTSIQQE
jgi:hypothetical protein